MKKILTFILLMIIMVSCAPVSSVDTSVEIRNRPNYFHHYHRNYRYYQPGYWTLRNGHRIYVGGHWYKVRRY